MSVADTSVRDRYARGGQPPLGIVRGPDGPEIHEKESPLVRDVFEQVALGLSIRRVAHAMEAKYGETWHPTQIHRLLHHETYVEVGLISPEVWSRAHMALQRNRRNRKEQG